MTFGAESMWAQVMTAPGEFELRDALPPAATDLDDGDVLLRTLAVGICGSDFPFLRGEPSWIPVGRPGAPFHEIVGEVVASRHDSVAVGSRVVGWAADRNAMAEFVVTRGDEVNTYGSGLPPRHAVLLQPLACVLFTMEQLPTPADQQVAVIGQGAIGLLFSHVMKSRGALTVTGVDPIDRTAVASRFGVDRVVVSPAADWVESLDQRDRPTIVIEAVGHQRHTLGDAIRACAPDGSVYYFGIPDPTDYPIPMLDFLRKRVTLKSGATLHRRRMLAEAGDYLLAHPNLSDATVTHVFGNDGVNAAMRLATDPSTGRLKVVLCPSSEG